MPIAEMLAWGSTLMSLMILVLTLLVWRKTEALTAHGVERRMTELEGIRGLLNFQLPTVTQRAVAGHDRRSAASGPASQAGQKTSVPQQFPLAEKIATFSRALGKWCEAAGDTPMAKALRERVLEQDRLVRRAMSERSASSTVAVQFAKQSAEIVMAVVSATDKDCVDDPRREELERQLVILVEGAGLALIDPARGAPLNYEEHQPSGGQAGGARLGRATIKTVLSRGVERPSAVQGSEPQVLAKAEVEVNY